MNKSQLVDKISEGADLSKAAAGRALVKASGSIKSLDQVRSLLEAGADLVGTSAGIQIVSDSATAATSSY